MGETKLTKALLDGWIKEIVGPMVAEIRSDNEKRAQEQVEKFKSFAGSDQSFVTKGGGDVEGQKGLGAARYLRAIAAGRGSRENAIAFAKGWTDPVGEQVVKALNASTGSAGGFIVPPGWTNEVIELLYNRTAVRKMGAVVVPMPNGTMTIPKVSGGATASYVGEQTSPNASQPTLGNIQLTYKKLRCTVPISNDLLQFASVNADGMVRNDMLQQISIAEDAAFLRGNGTQYSPKGLRNWAPTANVLTANATVNLANVTTDLGNMILQLEEANVPFIRFGWIFAPKTKNYLMTVRDGNGNYAYRPEMLGGTLWGYPFVATNQIPVNLGAGTDSEIIAADFNDVLIGESSELVIDASTEAAYLDENGNLVSAFANDQTVLRAIAKHDLGVRREESIVVLDSVKWGN